MLIYYQTPKKNDSVEARLHILLACKCFNVVFPAISDTMIKVLSRINKFRGSSAVERSPVKRLVVGSIPTPGASMIYCNN